MPTPICALPRPHWNGPSSNLGYTEVRAPIAGRVGKIEVTPGNLVPVGPTAPVLTTLVSVNPIYASFEAEEQSMARALASFPAGGDLSSEIGRIPVQLGTLAAPGTPFQGRLQLVDNVVDGRSGTVRLRAVFDNADGALMPGQFAHLRMGQAQAEKLLAIDERAIGTDQDRRFVLVVDDANKATYRTVRLGATVDGLRVVTDGLRPGRAHRGEWPATHSPRRPRRTPDWATRGPCNASPPSRRRKPRVPAGHMP